MTDALNPRTYSPADYPELQPAFSSIAEHVLANAKDRDEAMRIIRAVLRAMDRSEHGLWPPKAVVLACSLTALATGLLCLLFIR